MAHPKNNVIGACRLCKSVGELRDSHIVPKWAYRRIADHTSPNRGQPILMGGGVAIRTNEQITEHLLCSACEGLLSPWENSLSRLVVQEDDTFPWHATLPTPIPGNIADTSSVDTDVIARVASSVLWRASVATIKKCENVSLGTRYEESFRRYILGETPFPDKTSLLVTVFPPAPAGMHRIDRGFTLPSTKRNGGYHTHWFLLCGVRFDFLVGGTVPTNMITHTFHRSKAVMVDDGRRVREIMTGIVAESEAKGSLAKDKTP